MADHEGIITFALGAYCIADHLARAAELNDGMRIAVVRRDALDVDRGTRVDDLIKMCAQPIPVGLAVVIVDVTLVPDPDRVAHRALTQFVPLWRCSHRGTLANLQDGRSIAYRSSGSPRISPPIEASSGIGGHVGQYGRLLAPFYATCAQLEYFNYQISACVYFRNLQGPVGWRQGQAGGANGRAECAHPSDRWHRQRRNLPADRARNRSDFLRDTRHIRSLRRHRCLDGPIGCGSAVWKTTRHRVVGSC